jgi:hypothetical protein
MPNPFVYGGHHNIQSAALVPPVFGGTFRERPIGSGDVQWGYGRRSRPPYGRFGSYRPSRPDDNEPLYFDPRDPYGARPNTLTFNFTDPERNAAYLPRPGLERPPNALAPAFGYVPVNYVPPDAHPFHFAGRFNVPERSSGLVPHATDLITGGGIDGFDDQIPFTVPFPSASRGFQHPLYAAWYEPGVRHGRTRFEFPHPSHNSGRPDMNPYPRTRDYKAARPKWFDRPQAWPQTSQGSQDFWVGRQRPPPPPGVEAGSEGFGPDGKMETNPSMSAASF